MKAIDMTDKELRKENRRLIRNLSARIKNIENLGVTAPKYAVNKFRELEKTIPKRLTQLKTKELRTLYRDLKYISSLKSSSVKGAIDVQQKFEPVKEKLNQLSEPTQAKFWNIYGMLYENTGSTMEKFKYEIFETNIDFIYSGSSVDNAVEQIINAYDQTLENLGDYSDDETVKILFTQKLQDIRKNFK